MVWTWTTYCDVTTVAYPCRPTERRNEGGRNIRPSVVRFERWPKISEVLSLTTQTMTLCHARTTLKRYKGEQVTPESDLMSLSCLFIIVSSVLSLFSYYLFFDPITLSCMFIHTFEGFYVPQLNIIFYFCLSSCLSAFSWCADLVPIGQDWLMLRWKERKRTLDFLHALFLWLVKMALL